MWNTHTISSNCLCVPQADGGLVISFFLVVCLRRGNESNISFKTVNIVTRTVHESSANESLGKSRASPKVSKKAYTSDAITNPIKFSNFLLIYFKVCAVLVVSYDKKIHYNCENKHR